MMIFFSASTRIENGSYVFTTIEVTQLNREIYLNRCLRYVNSVACLNKDDLSEYCQGITVISQQWPPVVTIRMQVFYPLLGFITGFQEFSLSYVFIPCTQDQTSNCNPDTPSISTQQIASVNNSLLSIPTLGNAPTSGQTDKPGKN